MENKTQHGYLVLADISGYTSYLAQVELDHANEVLSDLLETVVSRFRSLLTVSKLEGDAVFAYAPEARLARGETLLELVESTYLAFRDRVEAARRRTTCDCRACRAIPSLELKFFIHHGDFILQAVSGIRELLGSDVNLIHRLMKNRVSENTGWRAYALFTAKVLEHMGTKPEGLHEGTETYEHLGPVQFYCFDLRPRYDALLDARRVVVAPEDAHVTTPRELAAPPPVVWEWLNDPHKRSLWATDDIKFIPVFLPGGRTGVNAKTHCVHGKNLVMVETVLDWRPFDYFTVEQLIGPMSVTATYRLAPAPDGRTQLTIYERGRLTSIGPVDRLICSFMFTRVQPTAKLVDLLERGIAEEQAQQQSVEAEASASAP